VTRQLYRALDGTDGLSVVKPVACYPHLLAIVTEEAPGRTLLTVLEQSARWWPTTAEMRALSRDLARLGLWIRRLQERSPQGANCASAEDIRTYIDVRLRRLAENKVAAFSHTDREAVLARVEDQLNAVTAVDLQAVSVHADLALSNVLVSGSRITVLDFAMAGTGTRCLDITHVYHQLDLLTLKPTFRRKVVRHLQMAVLEGFGEAGLDFTPLFQVMLLQHTVCHYLGVIERAQASLISRVYGRLMARRHLGRIRSYAASGLLVAEQKA
jgi:Ser/Thr protein kinase RdoA (MazF antagonist)